MAKTGQTAMGKPGLFKVLKERFVDRGLHQRIPSGTEVFYITSAKSDLWLQSMTSKATTTYLAWQTGGDHL